MARKTNKTAHVLNLLSGNNGQKSTKTESASEKKEKREKSAPIISSVKMDTDTKDDAVSELIHQQLLNEYLDEPENTPEVETIPDINPLPESEPVLEIPEPESFEEEDPAPAPKFTGISPAKEEEVEPESQKQPEPVVEKEPEFIAVNVVEQIVRDKIIYFMRQFDVCTCERCIADTIALTLNGLQPKYLVTPPSAVSPLINFYTNKYIPDITVEATKACIAVKENPRHTKTDETI